MGGATQPHWERQDLTGAANRRSLSWTSTGGLRWGTADGAERGATEGDALGACDGDMLGATEGDSLGAFCRRLSRTWGPAQVIYALVHGCGDAGAFRHSTGTGCHYRMHGLPGALRVAVRVARRPLTAAGAVDAGGDAN